MCIRGDAQDTPCARTNEVRKEIRRKPAYKRREKEREAQARATRREREGKPRRRALSGSRWRGFDEASAPPPMHCGGVGLQLDGAVSLTCLRNLYTLSLFLSRSSSLFLARASVSTCAVFLGHGVSVFPLSLSRHISPPFFVAFICSLRREVRATFNLERFFCLTDWRLFRRAIMRD